MFSITVYDKDGSLLEKSEQEEPVDIEALCKKHELGFWRHTQYVGLFSMTTFYCYRGRIQVKHIKEEENNEEAD